MTKEDQLAENERLKAEIEGLKAENKMLKLEGFDPEHAQLLGKVLVMPFPARLEELRDESVAIDNTLQEIVADGLSAMNRHQKNAIGDIRLGFVHNIFRYVNDSTEFNPLGFDVAYYSELIEQLDLTAQTITHLGSATRLLRDITIVTGDVLYGLALLWYRNIQVLAERRVPGAEAIYRELRTQFRHGGRTASAEPTEKQILHDVKALMHGKKDGEIVIEGKAKHTTAAEKSVVDDVHKPQRQNFRETVTGTVCKHCGCENGEDYVFCKKCGGKL